MEKYDFKAIESKWQKVWEEEGYGISDDSSKKPKYYHLFEFPYPSGAGLHVGHCMSYSASDAYCRMKRMQGFNVMLPIGWDAFGLPTENYAIKTGIMPQEATKQNVANFTRQCKKLGYSFDWSREINTTDPEYYRWTQWIFLQFYKHAIVDGKLIEVKDDDTETPRLAYQSKMPINWCLSCKIGLANEEVINGKCERCGAETEKRMQKQWMLRITAYADRLIDDLNTVDYLEKIKTQQINWIGRSEGAEVDFPVVISTGVEKSSANNKISRQARDDSKNIHNLKVFTTRPDTLFGATFMVVAPEHMIISSLESQISNIEEVKKYIDKAKNKTDIERTDLAKEKTGVELKGIKAINPVNDEEIPIFVADYVLSGYGTGAIMAVPAHDERDWEFAQKYKLPVIDVIIPLEGDPHENEEFRKTISVVVHRKSDDKYLLVQWNKFDWIAPSVGGVDEGEDVFKAAEREVMEETGYRVKAVDTLGGVIESHFFADNKKVWRFRMDQPVLCELLDEIPVDVEQEESSRHQAIWMSASDALQKITHPYNKIGLERYIKKNYSYSGDGIYINSDFLNGITSLDEARQKTVKWLEDKGFGKKAINYKLRDWIFSRQHYWGEPIPIIHCEKCGMLPLSESELPLTLPIVEKYQPTDTGESPLATISDWINVKCPKCGGNAKRETDTMPNWAGSSWYFLRYCDPRNTESFAGKEKLEYWMPVDLYNGGMEHTNLHLLYSRFWNKFLFDLQVVPTSEPYKKRIAHGIILGPDGRKMSKSFGNVINPDEIASTYGADALRAYIMFIGPYDQESAWSTEGLQGVYRFLIRAWNNFDKVDDKQDEKELVIKLHQTIKGVTDDIENFRMNTVISKLMEFNNMIEKTGRVSTDSFKSFLVLLFSACPHIASELWSKLAKNQITDEAWPAYKEEFLLHDTVEVAIQINGKLRDRIQIKRGGSESEVISQAMISDRTSRLLEGKKVIKTIYIPDKLINIVVQA